MMTLTIGTWVTNLLTVLFALVSAFMILVILIQKPKGGGLSGAFGGGGGGQGAVFGAKTGDVLTWFTVAGFVVFLLLGMGLVWSTRSDADPTFTPAIETSEDTGLPPALGGDSPGEAIIDDEDQLGGEPAEDALPAPPAADAPVDERADAPVDEPAGGAEPPPDETNDAEPNN